MFPKIKNECNILKDIPVLYLAPGPSLEENLEWIKLNQNKFYVVTVGAALKKLLDNNIRVDMVVSVDESDIIETLQFNDEILSKLDSKKIGPIGQELGLEWGGSWKKKDWPHFQLCPNGKTWRVLKPQLLELGIKNYKNLKF